MTEEKKHLDLEPGYVLCRIAFAFIVAGFIGWIYEFICGILNGDEMNLLHGGLGIPFLTIYAAGAVFIEVFLGFWRKPHHPLLQLLEIVILCTALEYATGWAMLQFVGVQTWDYRIPGWDFLASPDGLICLRASLTFGLLGLFLLRVIDPWFKRLWDNHRTTLSVITVVCVVTVILAILNANVLHIVDVGGQWQ